MRFLYIKLVDFKRLPLRESPVFEHCFTSKLLMIAGPNGAGKSSLLNELTPLPADKSNFGKNGYKEIHIEKDNKTYTLISDFRSSPTYSFNCDGEELNTAGLVTAQKELVEKYFNITPSVHELLTGAESFTHMSLLARKKLFSSITHLNIDKVLEGYNDLKEELKTNKVILKTQATAYQVEEEKLVNKDRLELIKTQLGEVKDRMDTLLTIRSDIQRYLPHNASDSIYELSNYVNLAKKALLGNYNLITSYPIKDIPRYFSTVNSKLSVVDYRLQDVYRQLETKEKELKQIEVVGVADSSQLLQHKTHLEETISRLAKGLRIFKDPEHFSEDTAMALYVLEANLPEILRNLQTNVGLDGEKLFTTEKYSRLIDQKRQQVEQLQQLSAIEISLKKNLDRAETMEGNVSCPACSHSWPIKDALTASVHTKKELEKVQQEQTKLRNLMAYTERHIDEMTEYFTYYKQFINLKKDTEYKLEAFWKSVYEHDIIFTDPTAILTILSTASIDVSTIGDIRLAKEELKHINSKLAQATSIAQLNVETIRSSIDLLDKQSKQLLTEKAELNEELSTIQRAKLLYEKLTKLDEATNKLRQNTIDYSTEHLTKAITNELDDEIRTLRVTALNLEKEIHETNTVQYALDKYKADMEDTHENIKVLNLALEELCPKSGLIAKSVSSFLNTIIFNINSTISKIWDYKMIVKPIDIDNDTLNYKFKVEVEDRLTVNDIATCSSGMKEILDLSFRMVLYRLLGFEGYPFFLDELGVRLDQNHRAKLMHLLFGMINSPLYSQIYMITHIDVSVANFRDVEVLEL